MIDFLSADQLGPSTATSGSLTSVARWRPAGRTQSREWPISSLKRMKAIRPLPARNSRGAAGAAPPTNTSAAQEIRIERRGTRPILLLLGLRRDVRSGD